MRNLRDLLGNYMKNLREWGRGAIKLCFILFFAVAFNYSFSMVSYADPVGGPQKLDGTKLTNAIRDDLSKPGQTIQSVTNRYSQAVDQFSGLSPTKSKELVESIAKAGAVDNITLGKLADGFFKADNPLGAVDVKNVTDTIDKFKEGLASPQAMFKIADGLANGELTSGIAKALSDIPDLGKIEDLLDIGNILDKAGVLKELEKGITELGLGKINELIGGITDLIASPEKLREVATDAAKQKIANELSQQIEKAAPELFKSLEGAFGKGAVSNTIASLFGLGGSVIDSSPDGGDSCSPRCSAKNQCGECATKIQANHVKIREHVTQQYVTQRNWVTYNLWFDYIAKALGLMTSELVGAGMSQVHMIGTFFDAKHQLESQRLFQQNTSLAHQRYHPDEQLCAIGTNTRSFANSKRRADLVASTVSTRMMHRQLNRADGISYDPSLSSDLKSRVDLFIRKYCDKNGGGKDADGKPSLALLCKDSPDNSEQTNADINFTASIENQLTLDANFLSGNESDVTSDEENIFAIGANLFANETLPTIPAEKIADGATPADVANYYYDLRSMAAKRNIAQTSYAKIVGMRAEGDSGAGPFLKAILKESLFREGKDNAQKEKLIEEAIEQYLGENPSLFAQEEVMMKLLYQNPEFYANLYTQPENVDRIGASLLALEIVQDRNIYESLLRSEATLATLIETMILKHHRRVSSELRSLNLNANRRGEP